ncbi:MAG: DUF1501 domain-containing protein [Opitutae bacterium]|nr:DUF1501 domain-containing protein [Opitutae bacterium]
MLARRAFINQTAAGLGGIALSDLMAGDKSVPRWDGVALPRHNRPRIKRVIFLYMAGGPSHLETFDPKPKLTELNGKPMPESLTKGQSIAQLQGKKLTCRAPYFKFNRHGKSGQEISEVFQHIPKVADDLCIVRSMYTQAINHDPAHTFINTGTTISGRPSMGSWLLYGLGSASQNLPGFVVMTSTGGGQNQPIASRQWHSGFLPGQYQGVHFNSTGDPVLYVRNPKGVNNANQRDIVDTAGALNRLRSRQVGDPEIDTRISQYELAFRMQMSVPELMDVSREPKHILDLYGTKGADGTFGGNCLLARRLAERGVRFIQLYHRGWDHHGGIEKGLPATVKHVDQGSAALVQDLKQRGMLDETLIVWAGEFGRTPMAQGSGRDHHMKGFSIWMAGGGIKPGITYGNTDELGYNAEQNRVSVHDLHATMLHLLGVEHKRLTFRYQGRDFRLTDVEGEVVEDILT